MLKSKVQIFTANGLLIIITAITIVSLGFTFPVYSQTIQEEIINDVSMPVQIPAMTCYSNNVNGITSPMVADGNLTISYLTTRANNIQYITNISLIGTLHDQTTGQNVGTISGTEIVSLNVTNFPSVFAATLGLNCKISTSQQNTSSNTIGKVHLEGLIDSTGELEFTCMIIPNIFDTSPYCE